MHLSGVHASEKFEHALPSGIILCVWEANGLSCEAGVELGAHGDRGTGAGPLVSNKSFSMCWTRG